MYHYATSNFPDMFGVHYGSNILSRTITAGDGVKNASLGTVPYP